MNERSASSSGQGRIEPVIGLAGLTQPAASGAAAGTAGAVPMGTPPRPETVAAVSAGAARAEPSAGAAAAGAPRRFSVQFGGSGSEYFRIWIVNLLLTLATLGLYFPWAKVRKLRYFYGNTQVAGHAFDFHGEPKRMLRGYALVGALFFVYNLSFNVSPVAGFIALLILAAIWPALFRASNRFRLAQTSWRGLRFSFSGTTGAAYKALLPTFIPAVLILAVVAWFGDLDSMPAQDRKAANDQLGPWMLAAMGLLFLVTPIMWWAIKRYQHDHYGLASVRTRFTAGIGAFYGLFLKAGLVLLGASLVAGVLAAVVTGAGAALMALGAGGRPGPGMFIFFVIGVVIVYAALILAVQPYFLSRMQNLLWNRTESRTIGFTSQLRYAPLLGLTVKNWLLMLLTLGLYWPFAAVATAKMRLEAVTVLAHGDLDALVARTREQMKDASGDAAADVMGLDVGL